MSLEEMNWDLNTLTDVADILLIFMHHFKRGQFIDARSDM